MTDMTDIQKAKATLGEGDYTCVICSHGKTVTSSKRGVAPLIELYDSGSLRPGFSSADKVVGRSAAYLYVLLGAKTVYARVMSKPAVSVLQEHGIEALYDETVDMILNRTQTGFCPMELAVKDVSTPEAALCALRKRLRELAGN